MLAALLALAQLVVCGVRIFQASVPLMKVEVPTSKFQFNLEALRGFASTVVLVSHVMVLSTVLNGVEQRRGLLTYAVPGHLAVLIFFMLSGYVIGLTVKNLTWQTTAAYLRKRFLRLYPIYVVVVLVAIGISYTRYPALQVVANLTFLHRVIADEIPELGVNWSLNYEVLFYLLFIPVAIYKLKPVHVFGVSLVLGLFFQFVMPVRLVAMYGYGFCFWVAGLWLARTHLTLPRPASRLTLVGLLLLFLAFGTLNPIYYLAHYKLHLDEYRGLVSPYNPIALLLSDLAYLPLGLVMISYFTNRRLRYGRFLLAFVLAMPLLFLLQQGYAIFRHQVALTDVRYENVRLAVVFYGLSLVLLSLGWLRPKLEARQLPQFMVATGAISYSLYLIHWPVSVLIGRVPFFTGTTWSFVVRVLDVIIISVIASLVLEKVWQPFAVRQLRKLKVFQEPAPARQPVAA
jgi:peptidoglycan/LPS O-acetylase OafA/YrhL